MPTFQSSITHRFNRPPDRLAGTETINISIPADSVITRASLDILDNDPRSSAVANSLPSPGAIGSHTVQVDWWLAAIPGATVTFRISVEHEPLKTSNGRVLLFEHGFDGPYLEINGGVSSLIPLGYNDKVSAIVVLSGTWIFYKDVEFKNPYTSDGELIRLERGMYDWVPNKGITNDDLSSLRPIRF